MSNARERSREIRSTLLSSNNAQISATSKDLPVSKIIAARIAEIQQLKTSVSTITSMRNIYQTLIRHKRRRAMAHDVSRLPRVVREAGYRELLRTLKSGALPPSKVPHRNIRRSKQMRFINHLFRAQKSKWLETHFFHAKRTKMGSRWGYRIALHTNDKADRAVEKFQAIKGVVCDVSNFEIVEIVEYCQNDNNHDNNDHNNDDKSLQSKNHSNQTILSTILPLCTNNYNQYVTQLTNPNLSTKISKYSLARLENDISTIVSDGNCLGKSEIPILLRFPSIKSIIFAARSLYYGLSTDNIMNEIDTKWIPWVINQGGVKKGGENKISPFSSMIIAPIRIQWVPNTDGGDNKTIWMWCHPSSTHIVQFVFQHLFAFFKHLQSLNEKFKNDQNNIKNKNNFQHFSTPNFPLTTTMFTVSILQSRFSRLSFRGPKSTTILARILTQINDENKTELFQNLFKNNPKNEHQKNNEEQLQQILDFGIDKTSSKIWSNITSPSNTQSLTQLPPNTILSLKVLDPYSDEHIKIQKNSKKIQTNPKSITQTSNTRFKLENEICAKKTVEISFEKSRSSKKIKSAPTPASLTSLSQLPPRFIPAGGLIVPDVDGAVALTGKTTVENVGGGLNFGSNTRFISAQWTPSSSSSHPSRYNPTVVGNLIHNGTVGVRDNGQNNNNNNNNNNQNDDFFSPLFDANSVEILTKFSPGNTSANNCAVRRNLILPLTSHSPIHQIIGQNNSENNDEKNTNISPSTPTKPTHSIKKSEHKLTHSPVTHALLVSRSYKEKEYQGSENFSKNNSKNKNPSQNSNNSKILQNGWDLIVPSGWGRSFFTAAVKTAGAVMIGHDQMVKTQLEGGDFFDSFPHNSTFPNSLPNLVNERVNRWELLIKAIRERKFKYISDLASFGALGPAYWALFGGKKDMMKGQNDDTMDDTMDEKSNENDDISPMNLSPPEQLKLISSLRKWLVTLSRYHRARGAKQRKLNQINNNKNLIGKKLISINDSNFDHKNEPKNEQNVIKKIHPKSICPISNLEKFSINHLPTPPRTSSGAKYVNNDVKPRSNKAGMAGKQSKRDGGRMVNLVDEKSDIFSHIGIANSPNLHLHNQVNTSLPLYSPYIASSRRTLGLLLSKTIDFSDSKKIKKILHTNSKQNAQNVQNAQNTQNQNQNQNFNELKLLTKKQIENRAKIKILLTSPYSPYYFPPLAWLHKRTHQNQRLLKPIVPVHHNCISAEMASDENYEFFNFVEYFSLQKKNSQNFTQNSFLFRNFDVVDNIYYHYPLLLNTIHQQDVHRKRLSLHNNLKQKNQQNDDAKMQKNGGKFEQKKQIEQNLLNTSPRLKPFPSIILDIFVNVVDKFGLEFLQMRSYLIDMLILYAVLRFEFDDKNDQNNLEKIIQNIHKNNKLIPIRFEHLSSGLLIKNSVISAPTLDEMETLYHHVYSFSKQSDKNSDKNDKLAQPASKPASKPPSILSKLPEIKSINSQHGFNSNSPMGYITHVHNSLKLGSHYGIGFVTIDAFISGLYAVLSIHNIDPSDEQIREIVRVLQNSDGGVNNDEHVKKNQTNQTKQTNQTLANNFTIFDLENIVVPFACHSFSNKKLAWGKIRIY